MAKMIACTQSSLLLHNLQPHATSRGLAFTNHGGVTLSPCYRPILSPVSKLGQNLVISTSFALPHKTFVSRASSLNIEAPPPPLADIKPDIGGGGGDEDNSGGSGGGGGGGDNNNGGDNTSGEGSDEAGDDAKKNKALLMSQKLTLAYAALIAFGGFMGYLKSGSQKSLAAGGLSSLLLYYVYTELPKRPVFASSVGLGISAALLGVMGSRFKKSGKVFPAGVVSLVSLIMSGGYLHGITKTSH